MNVIVLSLDALRADALGSYGSARELSPHLDQFAKGAVVFENAYAVTSVTSTSFAAFFTGRHPSSVFRNWRLRTEDRLALRFEEAGYATAGFMRNSNLARARGFADGFGTYHVFKGGTDANALNRATKWMRENQSTPFFVWIHLLDPHSPWHFHESARHLYDPATLERAKVAGLRTLKIEDPDELAHARALYDGEVFTSDRLFGSFHFELRKAGLLERSILVFTSDHGEEFMQHGLLMHGQLNEEDVRIPLIVHHPDLESGARNETVVSQLDLFPTLLSLTGLPLGEKLDGRDLRTVDGDTDPLLATVFGKPNFQQGSIRSGRWKLIRECGARMVRGGFPVRQLYDLQTDPAELHNRILTEPRVASVLEESLWPALGMVRCEDLQVDIGDEPDLETEGLDPEAIEQLEALGYIEG